jgi:hypothetical protein
VDDSDCRREGKARPEEQGTKRTEKTKGTERKLQANPCSDNGTVQKGEEWNGGLRGPLIPRV